jgi:hypothetical protein
MRKIVKILLTLILFPIFSLCTINAFAAKIIGCSNCKSDTSFGKIYNFDEKISNLKSNEFVVLWNGYLGTDKLTITHRGIIKNSKFIPIRDLNHNELCVFGTMDFPNLDDKYPNTILKGTFSKQIESRYSFWKEQFNKKSINEINKICSGNRKTFFQNYPLETRYRCDLNHSACTIIKFEGKKIEEAYSKSPKTNLNLKDWTNSRICFFAINHNKTDWTKKYQYIDYVEEAKKRGIDCEITRTKASAQDYIPSKLQSWNKLDEQEPLRCYDTISKKVYIIPAEGVNTQGRHQATTKCMGNAYRISENDYEKLAPKQNVYENDKVICYKATDGWSGKWSITNQKYVQKAIQLGLSCGIKSNPTIIAEENANKEKNINSEELEKEQQKRIELEKKLAALEEEKQKRKELEEKLAILSKKNNVNVDKLVDDNTAPVISAQSQQDGFYANISGTITDDVKLAEVLIDNKLITPNSDGTFNTKLYVPRNGLEVKILAFDMKGNKSTKTFKVERGAIEEASGPIFASLDPSAKKVKLNPNAFALIVGVANYSKTNADAIYADKDAQQFYDYARMKLGIPAKNIKELVNNKADLGEIALAVQRLDFTLN